VAEEYSFTEALGRSSCGRSGYRELEFVFQLEFLVFTYLVTIRVLNSDLRKIRLAPKLPDRKCCVGGGGVSV